MESKATNLNKYLRRLRHKRYVNAYLNDIRWDIVNTVVSSAHTGFNDKAAIHLENLGMLVRKYERRRRWLKL